ncbi:glycosyltransferase [Flavobacterium ginsengiterrae]|uniref:Glycosyltransferase 2-like domain-containing protein n=1 Tax=Flavobacterium ginsengiterrae TaxID=871695 RepID=A0ABP7H087_9FLAO
MRVGFNPQKDQKQINSEYFHQIIIPVYIPNQEGYFKDAFIILKYSLESLFKTCHNKTYITIVNNGSCAEVACYLQELFVGNKIHELIHSTNIGYINAMLKGVCGQNFPLITTADADVLFLEGWQKNTYNVFEAFPKAGAVCPTPSSRSYKTHTSNIFWDMIFSKKMQFSTVKNPAALKAFGHSVGNPNFYNKYQLSKYLTLTNNDLKAVVGAGHFVVTYRAIIFNELSKHTPYVLGGGSDDMFDLPVIKKDFWRLSTEDNYTYHMGNVYEDWIDKIFQEIKKNNPEKIHIPTFTFYGNKKWLYILKSKIFTKFIFQKFILKLFLKSRGLSKEAITQY